MRALVYNDLHLEWGSFTIPPQEDEASLGLILSGDIHGTWKGDVLAPIWIAEQAKRFAWVVYVLGNHEFYNSSIQYVRQKTREMLHNEPNVFFLDQDFQVIDDVLFIGATLWTDMDKGNPLCLWNARRVMMDHKIIWFEDHMGLVRTFTPEDAAKLHEDDVGYIFYHLVQDDKVPDIRKIVVVTHHSPSFESCSVQCRGDKLNGAFMSSLDQRIIDLKRPPDFWFHGHLHNNSDYIIGDKTRVICNPRGYYDEQLNKQFDQHLVVDI